MLPMILFFIVIFFMGASIGSFLNVVIYRLPNDQSIVLPRSHCPNCKNQLRWFHNIPIVSFLFLKAKCAFCGQKISMRYPLIELLCGIVALGIVARALSDGHQPFWGTSIFYFTVFAAMLAHFVIDIEHQLLPDGINLYLGAIFLLYALLNTSYMFWLTGFTIGLLFPLTIAWAFFKIRGIHGLGGGDIKLYAALGIFLGPIGVLQNIFLSSMLGTIFAIGLLLMKKMGRDTPMAFGPFIIIVALAQILLPFFGITIPSIL